MRSDLRREAPPTRRSVSLRLGPWRAAGALCLWLAAGATGCTSKAPIPTALRGPYRPTPAVQHLLDPRPVAKGPSWVGGDVAASIRISDDEWIWLFGDTLFGHVRGDCPAGQVFCGVRVDRGPDGHLVNNSIGRMRRTSAGFAPMQWSWRRSPSGEPRAVFLSERPGRYLWPLAGAEVDGALLVLANENTPASGLAPVANVLLRVENPLDPVERWRIDQQLLPGFRPDGHGAAISWTTALVEDGKWLYLVGTRGQATTAETVLARLPRTGAARIPVARAFEYRQRADDGSISWDSELQPGRLAPLRGLPGTTEATFLRTAEGWASWQIPPLRFDLRLLTAPALEGPWEDRGAVYQVPAPWSPPSPGECAEPRQRRGLRGGRPTRLVHAPGGKATCPAVRFLAYAPKAHPELAGDSGMVVTWNVNVFFGTLAQAEDAAEEIPGFYIPRALRSQGSAVAPTP